MIARRELGCYKDRLRQIPASGGGGCHSALLGIANLGRLAQINPDQVAQDLMAHVHGTRKITWAEIKTAVNKAFDSPSTITRNPNYIAVDGMKLLNRITEGGAGFTEAELWESSPVRINWPPEGDAVQVLRRLYAPQERLFIGTRHDAGAGYIRSVQEWIKHFEMGGPAPEHIIPNPLTGKQSQTKDGKPSFRADSCVARFKYAVVEFKLGSVGFVGAFPRDSSIIRVTRPEIRLPVTDPYADRMKGALRAINAPSYRAGMISWLGETQPNLYLELTSKLPDEIQRIWSERAPIEHFESVLARLVSLHQQCCEQYRAYCSPE